MRYALALIVCLSLPATSLAASSINRCVDASGNTVFTDRDCSEHGARDMPRAGSVADTAAVDAGATWSDTHGLVGGNLPNPQAGCAADPEELAIRLRVALESRDVNQLSSLYHWPGASSRGADSVLASLARTSQKGVYSVDVEPGVEAGPAMAMTVASTQAVAPPPRGLRVVHGPEGFEGYAPETTTFAMARNMGCWWIHY